jgi:hypothetical protein
MNLPRRNIPELIKALRIRALALTGAEWERDATRDMMKEAAQMLEDNFFLDRINEVLAEDADKPLLTWWLSFADGSGPKGDQFLGVVIVDGCRGLIDARLRMTLNGVASPGGEIQGVGFDPTDGPPDQVAALARLPRLTLLSKAALLEAGMQI